jgi:hypothetical protein
MKDALENEALVVTLPPGAGAAAEEDLQAERGRGSGIDERGGERGDSKSSVYIRF